MTIRKRKYKSYKNYLAHQGNKLTKGRSRNISKFMLGEFDIRVKSFEKRFEEIKKYVIETDILCLGARLGEEVLAFRKMGFTSCIGIDINPGPNNKYVVKGDFHNMPFEDGSFDTVYTNAIDHAWDLKDLSVEISRVLVSNGRLILEIGHIKGYKSVVKNSSKYESLIWEKSKDIVPCFKEFERVEKFESKHRRLIVIFDKK